MSITFSSVSATAAASGVYVEQQNVKRGSGSAVIPRKILIPGQYNSGYSPSVNVPQQIISKSDGYERYGRGALLSILLDIVLDIAGGVDVYALPISGGTSANTWTVTISGTATASGTISLYVEGEKVEIAVASGDKAADLAASLKAAFDAELNMPIRAGEVSEASFVLTCNFPGEIGKQVDISSNLSGESTPAGLTVTISDNEDGAGDPDISEALEGASVKWFTDIVCPYTSSDNIAALEAHGQAMNAAAVMKQFAGFVGNTESITDYMSTLDSRNSQWTTFVPVPGSVTSAFRLAAIAAAVYAASNAAEVGRPVKNLTLPGAIAGNEDMSDYKDTIVQKGGSWTINNDDETVTIGDLCTTKTTEDGVANDDWRFTDIIANIQFKIYALAVRFIQSPFDRGVVITDTTGAGPSYAVRPKTVKNAAIGLVRDWEKRGLTADADTVIEGITSEIDSSNAGRINLLIPDTPSAGLRILASKLEWGFLV